jgi:hypothetical protein
LTRPTAGGLFRFLVAAGLTALILWKSHPGEVVAHVAGARGLPLLIAVALVIVDRTLMASDGSGCCGHSRRLARRRSDSSCACSS